jgi:hypothetical protein
VGLANRPIKPLWHLSAESLIGEEAHQITTDANIEKIVAFLKQLGIAVVHDSHVHVLDRCAGLASLVTHVVTQDRSLLQLAKDGRRVVLFDKEAIDVFACETVISRFSVTPDSVPAFLAHEGRELCRADGPFTESNAGSRATGKTEHNSRRVSGIVSPRN